MLISERIKEICKSRGISVSKIEKELGFGNGTIGKWGKSGRTPTYDRIYAVAEYLGVPVFELTGEKKPASETGDGNDEELIRLLRLAPDDLKAGILVQIKVALAQRGLLPRQQEPPAHGPGTD